MAGEAATRAALDEVTGALQDARAQGRLIEALLLEVINAGYLVRDRMVQDNDEMEALMASLRARGLQPQSKSRLCPTLMRRQVMGLSMV